MADALGEEQIPALTGAFYRATRTSISSALYAMAAIYVASTAIDAARVSSCYGNYTQVRPLYECVRYYIKYS